MRAEIINVFHKNLLKWYRSHKRDLPWRRKVTPYRVAVAELMCQQTQIPTVLPYYERWMKRWPDWKSLSKAKESNVLKMWEGLGYYRRARALHAMAREVVKKYDGELPSDFKELQKLSGIGAYTAGAVASIAFNKKVPLVDGNVERLFSRIFYIDQHSASQSSVARLPFSSSSKRCHCEKNLSRLLKIFRGNFYKINKTSLEEAIQIQPVHHDQPTSMNERQGASTSQSVSQNIIKNRSIMEHHSSLEEASQIQPRSQSVAQGLGIEYKRKFQALQGRDKKIFWHLAEQLLPQKNCGDFNQSLMECGSQICTPRNPKCSICPLRKICSVKLSGNNPELLPAKKREKIISEKETLAWIQKDNQLFLELPKNPRKWKNSYRLPTFDSQKMKRGKKLFTINYTITKYRIHATVIRATPLKKLSNGKYFSPQQLKKIFLPSPHRKIVNSLKKM